MLIDYEIYEAILEALEDTTLTYGEIADALGCTEVEVAYVDRVENEG